MDRTRLRATIEWRRGNIEAAVELLLSEAERLEPQSQSAAASLLVLAAPLEYALDPDAAIETAGRAASLAPDDEFARLLQTGLTTTVGGSDQASVDAMLAAADRFFETQDVIKAASMLLNGPLRVLVDNGRNDAARTVLNRILERATASGARALVPNLLGRRGVLEYRTGNWVAALIDLSETVRLADELGQRFDAAGALPWLGRLEAALGREDDCRAHVARTRSLFVELDFGETFGPTDWQGYLDATLRLLELTLDRPERALELAVRPGEGLVADDWIEAAVRVGRIDEANAALEAFELEAGRLGSPIAQARAARCRGLLAADDEFEHWFARAFELEQARPTAFERARIELGLGERLRRADRRKEARTPLRSALEQFSRLGATHWAERARRELGSTGARVRASVLPGFDELTSQELAVARTVASGTTNAEAAAALFLSVKTIEFHLANVYRKLGVRSRNELARLLAEGGV